MCASAFNYLSIKGSTGIWNQGEYKLKISSLFLGELLRSWLLFFNSSIIFTQGKDCLNAKNRSFSIFSTMFKS